MGSATLISVVSAVVTIGETETTVAGVSEAVIEDIELLRDSEIRGGNVAPAVADARVTVARAITLIADSDLIAVKSATFDGSPVAGVKEASLEEQEVFVDEEVRGGGLLPLAADVSITTRPLITLLADDADELVFDGGIDPAAAGTLILTCPRKGAADMTITATNMVAGGRQPVRLPGRQVPRVQASRQFTPTQETVLTITAGGALVYVITAGQICNLVVTVGIARDDSEPTPLTSGTLTMSNMISRGLQSVRLPGQQTPRIASGRRFTPTSGSVPTFVKGAPA